MSDPLTLKESNITFLGQPKRGKVRDIYTQPAALILITTDRLSIFDKILPDPIFGKGEILSALSFFWFRKTSDLIPNHLIASPDPNVHIVKRCTPFPIEVIVRRYAVGSLWRDYKAGKREKCGVSLPEGLHENAAFPEIIVTPTTKNETGHDVDITNEEVIKNKLMTREQLEVIEETARKLFTRGEEILDQKGLILVDTKYEFGLDSAGQLTLIDEIHTPDSSRIWFKEDVEKGVYRFRDKETVRQWAMSKGFQGEGEPPALPQDFIEKVHGVYRELLETVTGKKYRPGDKAVQKRIEANLQCVYYS